MTMFAYAKIQDGEVITYFPETMPVIVGTGKNSVVKPLSVLSDNELKTSGYAKVINPYEAQYDGTFYTLPSYPNGKLNEDGTVTISWPKVFNSLENIKAVIVGRINQLREVKKWEPFLFEGNLYDADLNSAFNLTATIAGLSAVPEGFTWRTKDNKNIPMTIDDLRRLGQALLLRNNAVYQASWDHKAAVNALTEPETVIAYDYTVGWP